MKAAGGGGRERVTRVISLEAEALYETALAARPDLLFEDHIEPMLAAARP